jgi:hypothetical protein
VPDKTLTEQVTHWNDRIAYLTVQIEIAEAKGYKKKIKALQKSLRHAERLRDRARKKLHLT